MTWTKRHSQNAVAARARRRSQPAAPAPERRRYIPHPRPRAKWRLQLCDLEHGDSLTLRLYRLPWPGRYIDADGREFSAASLAKIIRALLLHAP